jgi:tripartite-type tricarboxylate transporter receptor subunit TctC
VFDNFFEEPLMQKLVWCLVCSLLPGAATAADAAAGYPSRPIRLIVPVAPGGTQDTIARALSVKMAERLGQQVVVDNRAGAGGGIGMELTARAAPDGHTIVSAQNGILCIAPHFAKVPYDPVKDFSPIALTATGPNVLAVHAGSVPARTFREFLDMAKAKPGQVSYGTSGVGSLGHLSGALLNNRAGVRLLHVPYKGGGQAVIDVVSGQVNAIILGLAGPLPHIRAGRLRALAVTSARRSSALPDVPTIAGSGYPGFDASSWFVLLAPAATPPAVVGRLNREVVHALKQPDVQKPLETAGFEVAGSSPAEAAALIRAELAQWGRLIKETGIRPE